MSKVRKTTRLASVILSFSLSLSLSHQTESYSSCQTVHGTSAWFRSTAVPHNTCHHTIRTTTQYVPRAVPAAAAEPCTVFMVSMSMVCMLCVLPFLRVSLFHPQGKNAATCTIQRTSSTPQQPLNNATDHYYLTAGALAASSPHIGFTRVPSSCRQHSTA
jgi:hypothetical protein